MKTCIKAAYLLVLTAGALASVPAHATPRPDIRVGPMIAAQGNMALAAIKLELGQAIKSWRPTFSKPAATVEPSRARVATGSGTSKTEKVQCAP